MASVRAATTAPATPRPRYAGRVSTPDSSAVPAAGGGAGRPTGDDAVRSVADEAHRPATLLHAAQPVRALRGGGEGTAEGLGECGVEFGELFVVGGDLHTRSPVARGEGQGVRRAGEVPVHGLRLEARAPQSGGHAWGGLRRELQPGQQPALPESSDQRRDIPLGRSGSGRGRVVEVGAVGAGSEARDETAGLDDHGTTAEIAHGEVLDLDVQDGVDLTNSLSLKGLSRSERSATTAAARGRRGHWPHSSPGALRHDRAARALFHGRPGQASGISPRRAFAAVQLPA